MNLPAALHTHRVGHPSSDALADGAQLGGCHWNGLPPRRDGVRDRIGTTLPPAEASRARRGIPRIERTAMSCLGTDLTMTILHARQAPHWRLISTVVRQCVLAEPWHLFDASAGRKWRVYSPWRHFAQRRRSI